MHLVKTISIFMKIVSNIIWIVSNFFESMLLIIMGVLEVCLSYRYTDGCVWLRRMLVGLVCCIPKRVFPDWGDILFLSIF